MAVQNFDHVIATYVDGFKKNTETFFNYLPMDVSTTTVQHPDIPSLTTAFHIDDRKFWIANDWRILLQCPDVKSIRVNVEHGKSFIVAKISNCSIPGELFEYMNRHPCTVIAGSFACLAAMKFLEIDLGETSAGDIDMYALVPPNVYCDTGMLKNNGWILPGKTNRNCFCGYTDVAGNLRFIISDLELDDGENSTQPCKRYQFISWVNRSGRDDPVQFENHIASLIDFTVASSTLRVENGQVFLTIRAEKDILARALNLTSENVITSVARCEKWKLKEFTPSPKTVAYLNANFYYKRPTLFPYLGNSFELVNAECYPCFIYSCENTTFIIPPYHKNRHFKIVDSNITILICNYTETDTLTFEYVNSNVKFGNNILPEVHASHSSGTSFKKLFNNYHVNDSATIVANDESKTATVKTDVAETA
jgi:hypothetical protein